MREACLIMPTHTSAGHLFPSLHYHLALDLAREFGGYTVTQGNGGWIDPKGNLIAEPVSVYTIAGHELDDNNNRLVKLAARYGAEANQQSVYWRDFSGNVHIDTLAELQARVEIAEQYEPKSWEQRYGKIFLS